MIAMIILDDAALNMCFFDTTPNERCQEHLDSSEGQVFLWGLPGLFIARANLCDGWLLPSESTSARKELTSCPSSDDFSGRVVSN
jgi:hypothetical protein